MASAIELEKAYQKRADEGIAVAAEVEKKREAKYRQALLEGPENVIPPYLWPPSPALTTQLKKEADLWGYNLYFMIYTVLISIALRELLQYTNPSSHGLQRISLHQHNTLVELPPLSVPKDIRPLVEQLAAARRKEGSQAATAQLLDALSFEGEDSQGVQHPPLMAYTKKCLQSRTPAPFHSAPECLTQAVYLQTRIDHVDIMLTFIGNANTPLVDLVIQDIDRPRLAKI